MKRSKMASFILKEKTSEQIKAKLLSKVLKVLLKKLIPKVIKLKVIVKSELVKLKLGFGCLTLNKMVKIKCISIRQ